nr:MAG TPA: hypothetical protein [Caudoviricetes sp.]
MLITTFYFFAKGCIFPFDVFIRFFGLAKFFNFAKKKFCQS